MRRLIAILLLIGVPLRAQDVAGTFDYYVLSLSWSANWCALEGDAQASPQCDPSNDFDWVLHGLWPQFERGFPSYCSTGYRAPSRHQTNEMADVMGTSGLAWHQWRKHGVCTGLSPQDYYALSRAAYARITRPDVFRRINRDITVPARVIEQAFLKDNTGLQADQITITCRSGFIQEARICMTRDLAFRTCGADVVRDCTMQDAQFSPMR